MDPLRRVIPGTDLAPSAAAWNAFCDLVKRDRRRLLEPPSSPDPQRLSGVLVRVRNIEEETEIPRFGIVAIRAPVADPASAQGAFLERSCLDGDAPIGVQDTPRVGIATDPLPPGRVGRIQVAGIAVCKVEITDPDAGFASATASTEHLVTDPYGTIPILWREDGTSGVKWAIVRIQGVAGAHEFHLTGADAIPGTANRFAYEMKLSRLDAETLLPIDITGGLTITGTNIAEDFNDADQVAGFAVADVPSGMAFYPVGDSPDGWVGATVHGWLVNVDGVLQARFCREMQLLGSCTMGAEDQRSSLGLGSAALLEAPEEGDAADSEVVLGNDTRLNHPVATDFTTPGTDTYDIPPWATELHFFGAGSGSGGGSGRRGAAGTNRFGGASGASGAVCEVVWQVADLGGDTTLSVFVPDGGDGGAAPTTDDTNGNAGAAGAAATVTSSNRGVIALAGGATSGGGGGTSTGGTGGNAGVGLWPGTRGANGGSGAGTAGTDGQGAPAGGGAGGGLNTSNTQTAGGAGGIGGKARDGTTSAATGGAAGGSDGADGSAVLGPRLGHGGAGGGSSNAGGGGQGGAGTRGAGGGGGGASTNGTTGKPGGKGGSGFWRITAR